MPKYLLVIKVFVKILDSYLLTVVCGWPDYFGDGQRKSRFASLPLDLAIVIQCHRLHSQNCRDLQRTHVFVPSLASASAAATGLSLSDLQIPDMGSGRRTVRRLKTGTIGPSPIPPNVPAITVKQHKRLCP